MEAMTQDTRAFPVSTTGGRKRQSSFLGRKELGRRLSSSWLPSLLVPNSWNVRKPAWAPLPVQEHVCAGGDSHRRDLKLSPTTELFSVPHEEF